MITSQEIESIFPNDIGIICNSADEIYEAILDIKCHFFEKTIGFPMVIRPSYVIGGRGMKIAHNTEEFKEAMRSL